MGCDLAAVVMWVGARVGLPRRDATGDETPGLFS
jgi:hypothetical protein